MGQTAIFDVQFDTDVDKPEPKIVDYAANLTRSVLAIFGEKLD